VTYRSWIPSHTGLTFMPSGAPAVVRLFVALVPPRNTNTLVLCRR
jgi:hypothetical protein